LFGPVEDLGVQGVDEGFDQVGGGVVELADQVGQFVEQGVSWSGAAARSSSWARVRVCSSWHLRP
jgi:hypothetical protein